MSGVQGPLETRTKTTVETQLALQGLDATPFDSGELAYVRATGATYELVREDLATGLSTFDSVAVGPPGSVGRWRRLCLFCTGESGSSGGIAGAFPFVAFAGTGPAGASTSSLTPVTLLSTTIPTVLPASSLFLQMTYEGDLGAGVGVTDLQFRVDGVLVGLQASVANLGPGASNQLSTSLSAKVAVTAGVHVVELVWNTNGATATLGSGGDHATLSAQEVL